MSACHAATTELLIG